MNKQVYMDYSATTYTKPEVLEEMLPFFTENFGNPSSLYSFSDKTKKAVNLARERVAKALNAEKMRYSLQVVVQKQITGL
ncbi:cysteine desulfurase [Clostridium botulinum A1 str. CFSAN002368]|nr:cysteine desulfurase [Clostridium botulinum A1 str. CFSAN002368]